MEPEKNLSQRPSQGFDALMPAEMAEKAEKIGVAKVHLPWLQIFWLSILAGAFIALGAVFYTIATAGLTGQWPFGMIKLVGGLVFCLGLILVIVAGAELFTGNSLIVMAWAGGKINTSSLLKNWGLVYLGNFIGAVATVILMLFTKQYTFGKGIIGINVLEIANAKCQLDFVQAVALGVMCNALVCLAVWLCFSARSTTDKILAIIFPITAFVAAGFEHSIANMYFIPAGLLLKDFASPEFWEMTGIQAADYIYLSWNNFFVKNLLPVTLGNIIGGGVLVGMIYWFIYLRTRKNPVE